MADYNLTDAASPNGLDPQGWWPGKKHTWKERLGQVATLGVWNPDDRTASDNNKMQLKARAGANEVLAQMTQNLIRVGTPPEQAAKMANEVFASKYQADTMANKAAEAESEVRQARAKGRVVHAMPIGEAEGRQDLSAANAGAQNNQNVLAQSKLEADAKVPEQRANVTLGELATQRAGQQGALRKLNEAELDAASTEDTRRRLRDISAGTAVQDAENAAAMSKGQGAMLRDPARVQRMLEAAENKNNAIITTYGSSAQNILYPDAGTELMGPEHLAPGAGAGNVGGYTTTREVLDKMDPTKTRILTTTRTPLRSTFGAETGAPAVQPNLPGAPVPKKPIRIIGN